MKMSNQRTTQEERDDYIRSHYPHEGAASVAEHLNITINAVRTWAHRLGVSRDIWRPWTSEREQYIIDHYFTDSYQEIAAALDIAVPTLKTKLTQLKAEGRIGSKPRGPKRALVWTDDRIEHVIRRYYEITGAELALEMDISISTLNLKLAELRAKGVLSKKPRKGRPKQLPGKDEQANIAYLAGIFDAGAYFQVRKRAQPGRMVFYGVQLHVTMPNPTIANLFQRVFGGKLETVTNINQQHGKLAWYSRDAIYDLLVKLQPYAQHRKFSAMLDFLDCPCDEHMQLVMARVDPWAETK